MRVLLYVLALGVLFVASGAQAQSTTVLVDGVPRQVPVVERQNRRFIALEDVARLLGGQVLVAGPERSVLVVDDMRMTVHRRSPFVLFGDRWYQMIDAAQKDLSGFYLPATSLKQLLPVLWPERFPEPIERPQQQPVQEPEPERDPADGGVESGMISRRSTPAGPRVDVWVGPERTRLGFRLDRVPGIAVDDALPGMLQLRFSGVSLDPALARGLEGVGLVDSVRVDPGPAAGVLMTVWVDEGATLYAVSPLERPAGFELVLRSGAADEAVALLASDVGVDRSSIDRRSAVADARPSSTSPPAPTRSEWTIMIDPGHGGHEPGSVGPGNTREKDVTLAVARELADRLSGLAGVEVLMTRDEDEFVALGDRTRMANEADADLFVSLHANASRRASAGGFETYFLSAAKTEDERRVARMENSVIRYENPQIDPESLGDLNFILWDLAQNEYLRESSALAGEIQDEIGRRVSLRNRGVKQAGFYVLNGAFMPAILFEMAFISNPQEEALLNDPQFRTRLVEGLAESLLRYLRGYDRRSIAQRSG